MPDFGRFQDRYRQDVNRSISFVGKDVDFFAEVKANLILELLQKHVNSSNSAKVLDVGCGIGLTDGFLVNRGVELHGTDVSPELILKASQANPGVSYLPYDGEHLPYPDGEFDLVFAICVLHHVPLKQRSDFVRELKRVTKRKGCVAIFEHNPLNVLTRLAVYRCEFDKDAILLGPSEVARLFEVSGLHALEKSYILFFPFKAKAFRTIESGLKRLPLGAQYYVIGTPIP